MARSRTGRRGPYSDADGQLRLMAESVGMPSNTFLRRKIDTTEPGDWGSAPIGDGRCRMHPSGEEVDSAEARRRLDERMARIDAKRHH